MADELDIYQKFRCPKCEHRLTNGLVLKCEHLVCQKCLEAILRNHRTNATCPACRKPLGEYQIENYTFLPSKHVVTKLLSSFAEVNLCETCKKFTDVEACSQCQHDQCASCRNKHEQTHKPTSLRTIHTSNELSSEEMGILQLIERYLTREEFEALVQTARMYLNDAAYKEPVINLPDEIDESTMATESIGIYDWSKHQKITVDDIINSQPERVKKLLRLDFLPRPYQIRMIKPGLKNQNSLVCLQTGAGKTFVAGMLAKFMYIRAQQGVNQSQSATSKRFKAVFLVPIKALVDQQSEAFRKVFIDQPETILRIIDNQTGDKFKELYRRFDIFFCTVQKFANFIESKDTDLRHFDLLMIDECHHCYDNHPINLLMRQYHRLKLSGFDVPNIIALTASVGTNKKNAFIHLVHLCANLDCCEISAIEPGDEENELRQSTNTPLTDTIITVPKEEDDTVVGMLKDDVMKAIAGHLGYNLSMMDYQKIQQFLTTTNQQASKTSDRDVVIGTDYLQLLTWFLIYYDDLPLEECIKWFDENLKESTTSQAIPFDAFCRKKIQEFRQCAKMLRAKSFPIKAKLQKLVQLISSLHEPDCRGLILVRTKFHTVALKEFLNNCSELKKKQIVVGHVTGQGSTQDYSLPAAQQAAVFKEFRQGTKNLLVATDVAQEGIDIAECSYVIRYEFVSNEIGAVQGRGRARALQSRCFLLTEALSINYQRELENREKELQMREALDDWRRQGVNKFRQLVHIEQDELEKELCNADRIQLPSSASAPSLSMPTSPSNTHTAKTINCRFCDTYLCDGSHLRLQGTTVVCIEPAFERLVNPPKAVGAKFLCPNTTCHRELGGMILLSRNIFACVFQISALKFFFKGEIEPRLFKKWSLYPGHMETL